MDGLNSDCLVSIFNHLDLASRLQASKTCGSWRELLHDSGTLMDDISQIDLADSTDHLGIDIQSVATVFSNIQQCNYLNLFVQSNANDITDYLLYHPSIKQHLFRFGTVRFFWNGQWWINVAECLTKLREASMIKNLSINTTTTSNQYLLDLSGFQHLERFEIDFNYENMEVTPPTNVRLPPSLLGLAFGVSGRGILAFGPVERCLKNMESCPLLEDLKLGGLYLHQLQFLQRFPNLKRLHFRDSAFCLGELATMEGLLLEWIKFEECTNQWIETAEILIKASNVKKMVIVLKDQRDIQEMQKINRLVPSIEAKNATLELTIKEPRGQLIAPLDFCHVLTKLELISVNFPIKLILIGNSFGKLTELKLENCTGLDDSDLKAVAEWCLRLEKFNFKPVEKSGITDQCLQPFFKFWEKRESRQLSIECPRTDLAFGWFQGQPDEEKGVFDDGKFWMRFGNSAGKKADGAMHVGTRMAILDESGKMMVIRDYEKNFQKKLQIEMFNEGCRVKEVMSL